MSNTSKKTVGRSEVPARRVRRPSTPVVTISDEQVARLAYQYYLESGCEDGNALEHWLRAEGELRGR